MSEALLSLPTLLGCLVFMGTTTLVGMTLYMITYRLHARTSLCIATRSVVAWLQSIENGNDFRGCPQGRTNPRQETIHRLADPFLKFGRSTADLHASHFRSKTPVGPRSPLLECVTACLTDANTVVQPSGTEQESVGKDFFACKSSITVW